MGDRLPGIFLQLHADKNDTLRQVMTFAQADAFASKDIAAALSAINEALHPVSFVNPSLLL